MSNIKVLVVAGGGEGGSGGGGGGVTSGTGSSAPTLTTAINKADAFVFLVTLAGNYDGYIVDQNVG